MIKAPEQGRNDQETLQNLMDAVMKMRKELNFILYNLDDKNIPMLGSIVGDIDGIHTSISQTDTQITLLAQGVADNASSITLQEGQIQSLVTSVGGNSSAITQLSNEISLKVSNSQYTASIIVDMINNGSVTISANRINLNGVTTMEGLARVAQTLDLGINTQEGRINIGRNWATGQPGATISSFRLAENNPGLLLSAVEVVIGDQLTVDGVLDLRQCSFIHWGSHGGAAKFG